MSFFINLKRKINFLIIFLILLNINNLCASKEILFCKDIGYKDSKLLNPKNFQKIGLELEILNNRKWFKSLLNNLIQINENNGIVKKRPKVDALININFDKKLTCKLKVKIRAHGDYYDHYVEVYKDGTGNLKKPYILPSLRVEINETHLFGITEFILFKPVTRYHDNEIFVSTFFEALGLKSPRSMNVQLDYNKKKYNFILQEVINKEFLENNSLVEGAIYSGDERFFQNEFLLNIENRKFIILHKLDNGKWIKEDKEKFFISDYGLKLLNLVNFLHTIDKQKSQKLDYYTSTKNTVFEKYFDQFPLFDSLSYALDADNPLNMDDRRFYFDVHNNKFIPIYYDGMSKILDDNYIPLKEKVDKNNIRFFKSAVNGSYNLKTKVENINLLDLKKTLSKRGVSIGKTKLEQVLNNIKDNINIISKAEDKNILVSSYNEIDDIKLVNAISDLDYKKIFSYVLEYKDGNYLVCDLTISNCNELKLNINEKVRLLNQKLEMKSETTIDLKNFSNLIYLGNYERYKKFNSTNLKWDFDKFSYSEHKLENESVLKLYGNFIYDIDYKSKKIYLERIEKNSHAFFSGGTLSKWIINFEDKVKINNKNNDNTDIFTGCLTFIDIEGSELAITANNAKCEDAINFIRFSGNIKNLKVNNSSSDAIDFDFSKSTVDRISINNALNDCLDLSYGHYKIDNLKVTNCGDKGISIGENSKLYSNFSYINNVNVGVASKDYSEAFFYKLNINKTDLCLAAYNKKHEFSGGYIEINELNCNNFKTKKIIDDNSIILINNLDTN